jgi:putative flippase GtrA
MTVKPLSENLFLKFLLASGIAAAVNFFSRMGLGLWMSYSYSIVVAYLFGIITAFILCRCFIFTPKENSSLQQILYFCLVNVVAIAITLVVSLVLYRYVLTFVADQFLREEIAHFIGVCAPAVSSYFGHKHFSFR